jgi:hypothetical protein
MSTDTAIPTTIQPAASEFAARFGLGPQLAEIVEHIKQTVPGLGSVAVEFAPAYDSGEEGILIHACRDARHLSHRQCWEEFSAWKIGRFPAEVGRHFSLILSSNEHGG